MKKTPFKLTRENYFSPDRPHLSLSRIKDYQKDPYYYKRKHIDKDPTLAFVPTPSSILGSIVDDTLTGEGADILYEKKVKKKEDPDTYERQKDVDPEYLVSEGVWSKAQQIIEHLKTQPIWTDGAKNTEFQVVLEGRIAGTKVCGLADKIIDAGDGKWFLDDLKVTNTMKLSSPEKWLMNCFDMGYVKQLALYQRLFAKKKKVKDLKKITCRHIVAAWQCEGLTKVEGFIFPQDMLDKEYAEVVKLIKEIKKGEFPEPSVGWNEAWEY